MTPSVSVVLTAMVGGLGGIIFPAAAWAHHPMPRLTVGDERSWTQFWFLGVCVFMIVFVVTWVAFSFFERRQRSESGEPKSSRR